MNVFTDETSGSSYLVPTTLETGEPLKIQQQSIKDSNYLISMKDNQLYCGVEGSQNFS
jgi:hypothetical protein